MSKTGLILIAALLTVLTLTGICCTQPTSGSMEKSRQVAEEFVKKEDTFQFDGIPDTLKVISTTAMGDGWIFTIQFDSRHAGYGDRTGKVLAEVITPHKVEVNVQAGQVIKAMMDEQWDMINCSITFDGTLMKGEGFAIYLTRDDIPPSNMEALSHVEIAAQPIISTNDIIAYNAQTHEIKLTAEAFERIAQLDVPVRGRSFMVCVDKAPIYWGAFWTPISSMAFDGVTIWKPLSSERPEVITLQLGYPSSSHYGGEDPRNNPIILGSLEKAGKLIDRLSITSIDRLPYSIKGYELYSRLEDSQWHFTLITGTNRTKTMEEITSSEDFISETGWVNIHVVGADEVKYVLSKLPQGESVFWCDELHTGQTTQTDLQLPPVQIIETIKKHAEQCNLDFSVTIR